MSEETNHTQTNQVQDDAAISRESLVASVPTPATDFDWDTDDSKYGGDYSQADRESQEALYAGTLSTVQPNTIIDGTVAALTDRDVVLNIGFKSDGLVSRTEFRDMPDLKVGDIVAVLVMDQENKDGQLVLSRKSAKLLKAWETITTAHEQDLIVEGKVKSRTKGGLVVDISGIETFLPGSQIDVKPVRDYDQYVGKTMEFKVVKLNPILKNAVVSHKILIEKDLEAQKAEIIANLEKGQVLEGIVKNITDFGAFIDLGGIDGLLHITDISWGRVTNPRDVLTLDEKLNVVILNFEDGKKRISLGLKQLTPHPWDALTQNIELGSRIKGKVVNIAEYGAFIEVAQGVEGLIHVSEMSWSQHLRNPSEILKVDEEIEAVVLSIEREERKMSLGLKQLSPDPWTNIEEKYLVGSRHKGKVRNLTNFGLFVELGEGVDGLVHVSDLSWTKKINHPSEFIKKDEEIEVVVLEVDNENRRLSLGHKQLEDNPWDTFETIFMEGSDHEAKIISSDDKGAVVELAYGLDGFVPRKQLNRENGAALKVGETATFRVLEFNKDNRRIALSHTRTWEAANAAADTEVQVAISKKKTEQQANVPASMGDNDVLNSLKAGMVEEEKKAQQVAIKEMDAKAKKKATKKDATEAEATPEADTTAEATEATPEA